MAVIIVSCECGATFERMEVSHGLETGQIDCPHCGRGLVSWSSTRHPDHRPLKLKQRVESEARPG